MSDHHRKLEQMYLGAACNEYYRPRIVVDEGRAKVEVEVDRRFFHSAGAVHGSVYFKLLDDAAYFAANSLVTDVFVLTVSFDVQFVRPISRGTIRGEGRVIDSTARLLVAESTIEDDRGRSLGFGRGLFMRSDIALGPSIGYAFGDGEPNGGDHDGG